jgi:hypothetical protein
MSDLPDAETLYAHFFAPWIPPDDPRERLLRPDLEQIELDPGVHIRNLTTLTEEGRARVERQIQGMIAAARADLPGLLGVSGEPTIEWLNALETWASPERLRAVLRSSNPENPDNSWLLLCCESGALIGELLQQAWPSLRWLGDFPYFESCLFDLNAKVRIPVFHWAAKTLSGDERHPLAQKIQAAVAFLREG